MPSTPGSLLVSGTAVIDTAYDPTGEQTTPAHEGTLGRSYDPVRQDRDRLHAHIDDASPLGDLRSNVYLHPHFPPRKMKSRVVLPSGPDNSKGEMKKAWKSAMPSLVDAYVWWRTHTAGEDVDVEHQQLQEDAISPAALLPSQWVVVDVVGEKEYQSQVRIPVRDGDSVLVALMRAGLLPCNPCKPTLVVSIDVLDLFLRIKMSGLRTTTIALCAMLCKRYMMRLVSRLALGHESGVDLDPQLLSSFSFGLEVFEAEAGFSMLMREVKRRLDASAQASRPPQTGFLRRIWGSLRRSESVTVVDRDEEIHNTA